MSLGSPSSAEMNWSRSEPKFLVPMMYVDDEPSLRSPILDLLTAETIFASVTLPTM